MSKLLVGVGRADITPSYSVPLAGYGNTSARMSTEVYDPQYSTCIAFTDESGETVLLYHNDLTRTDDTVMAFRPAISQATGVPVDHIVISATHNHSAPDTCSPLEVIQRYLRDLEKWMTDAALAALADRKAVKDAYVTSTQVKGVNFTRHYIMDDGSICGDNLEGTGTKVVGYVNEADHTLSLIKFVRENDKDVIMANFQAHPHSGGGFKKYYITSDMVGAMRDMMEKEAGCRFLYFSGGSGNVNSNSRIKEDNIPKTYIERGQYLAQAAMRAADGYEKVTVGKIRLIMTELEEEINHSEDGKLEDAKRIAKLWADTNDRLLCVAEGAKCGIKSPYHANAIVAKAGMPKSWTLHNVGVFSIGDIAFAIVPYEMFHQMGSYIRENSPFKMTFIVTCANGSYVYHPTKDAYEFCAYESCLTRAFPGTAEKQAEFYVKLLKEL